MVALLSCSPGRALVPLAALVALHSGCAETVGLNRSRTAELAHGYAKDRDAVLLHRGNRRHRLGPENEPALELELWREPDHVLSAPLEAVRADGDGVVLPDGRRVQSAEVRRARLVLHGEPLTRLERQGRKQNPPQPMVGMQFGGTGFLQFLGRMRVVGPLHVELGAAPAFFAPAGNASAGLVVERSVGGGFSTYGGAGGGAGFASGYGPDPECSADFGGCPYVSSYETIYFAHGRVGLGYRFEANPVWLGVDAGTWYGRSVEKVAERRADKQRLLWPMGGLAVLYEL